MKVAACLLLVCLALALANGSFPTLPIPSFLWAGNSYFLSGTRGEYSANLRTNTLVDFLRGSATAENALVQHIARDLGRPEVVVVWVQPASGLSNAGYGFLRSILSQAGSSLVLPYVYSDTDSVLSEAILSQFTKDAKIIVASTNNKPNTIPTTQLLNTLQENRAIFINGVLDLVLVYVNDEQEERSALISTVDQYVNEQTAGKYVACYTAEREYIPLAKVHKAQRMTEVEKRDGYDSPTYWPREIWEAMLVVAIMLMILVTGVWCTFELQAPTKWEKKKDNKQ